MNETGDILANLPAIIVLSLWWAFLSTLGLFVRPPGFGPPEGGPGAAAADEAPAAPADPRLRKLLEIDPRFSAEAFLDGARSAYERIVQAYAAGDLGAMRSLASEEILDAFSEAGAARACRGETLELTFVGIDCAEIAGADVAAEAAEITVLFHAEIVCAVRASSGRVVSGDPASVIVTGDLWTFSRPPADSEAPWVVVATGRG